MSPDQIVKKGLISLATAVVVPLMWLAIAAFAVLLSHIASAILPPPWSPYAPSLANMLGVASGALGCVVVLFLALAWMIWLWNDKVEVRWSWR